MRYLIVLLLFFKTSSSLAQVIQEDSADYYISQLNWTSATVTSSYIPKIDLNNFAQKLVKMQSKFIENKLYEKITDTQKTLAIHVILTQRHDYTFKLSEEGYRQNEDSITKYQIHHYTKDTLLGIFYEFNGLKWYYNLNTGQASISKDTVKYIQQYWVKKLKKKKIKYKPKT